MKFTGRLLASLAMMAVVPSASAFAPIHTKVRVCLLCVLLGYLLMLRTIVYKQVKPKLLSLCFDFLPPSYLITCPFSHSITPQNVASSTALQMAAKDPSPLTIGIFGGGVVGGGIVEIIESKRSYFEEMTGKTLQVKKICVKDASKPRVSYLPSDFDSLPVAASCELRAACCMVASCCSSRSNT